MWTRAIGGEAVALDQVDDGAVAVEQRRRADDELQLELGMSADARIADLMLE